MDFSIDTIYIVVALTVLALFTGITILLYKKESSKRKTLQILCEKQEIALNNEKLVSGEWRTAYYESVSKKIEPQVESTNDNTSD